MADKIDALGNLSISNYKANDVENFLIDTSLFLQNQMSKQSSGLRYNKVGDFYFITGTITFTELVMDILPEKADVDGILNTDTSELIYINKGSSSLTATSLGLKTISGFYAAKN